MAATVAALAGRLGRRRRAVVLIAAILAYVLFAGASPSVVRAAAMAGVVLLARETGRAGRAAAALGWAAALLLLADPQLVLDPGFQLSTLATGGILAWASRWTERIGSLAGGRVPRWLAESLGVSLAAQAATLPVVLLTFGRLALVSPAVNLLIVPLVAPAMGAALVALLGGAVALAGGPAIVATIAGLPAWVLLTAMCTVIRAGGDVAVRERHARPAVDAGRRWRDGAAHRRRAGDLAPPARSRARRRRARAAPSMAAPLPVASRHGAPARARPRAWRLAILAVVAAAVGLGLSLAHRPDGAARITVLDVGQGDAILVEGGRGGRMLVDGGPDPDRLLVELDRRLPPWDRRIDILVLTHPHEDHVAGMPLLLDRYRIGRIYETGMRGPGPGYRAFAKDLERPGAPPHGLLATGASIGLDGIRLRVLWPDPGRVPLEPPDAGRGINDVSVVLLGEVAGRRFLLTGDVEDDVDPLLASRGLPPVDILKVAHHGSATASTPAFLDAVHPRVAIVSAGAGNPYGHPARSTIERLQGTGARVLRTDTDGTVSITIDPGGAIDVTASGPRKTSDAGGVRAAFNGGIVLAGARVAARPSLARCPADGPDRHPEPDRLGLRDTIERMTDVALAYLYGDDDLTIDRVIDKFATSLAEGGAPLERWSLRGNRNAAPAQLAELHGRIATPVLFGGGTLAVVRNPGALMVRTEDREALLAIVPLAAAGNGLVIVDETASGAKAPVSRSWPRRSGPPAASSSRSIRRARARSRPGSTARRATAGCVSPRARRRSWRRGSAGSSARATRTGGTRRAAPRWSSRSSRSTGPTC